MLCQFLAKPTSNRRPGSVEAAKLDENPHTLTEEGGEPNPHLSPSASGEIYNVTPDNILDRGAQDSGAPKPHSRRPSRDETDLSPDSQPGKITYSEMPQNIMTEGNGVAGPGPRKPP